METTAEAAPILSEQALRDSVFKVVREFYKFKHAGKEFIPGVTPVPPSGKVFDQRELVALVDSALDFWLTEGRYAKMFERSLSGRLGLSHVILANSGSSANLLAVSALTSPELGHRQMNPGDEVITVASSFPTTINPVIQNGLVPVFVDIHIPTYNAVAEQVESALSPKTKAVFLAHTLGNPLDLSSILDIVRRHDLWLIEDCCDALGARYLGRPVSTFGDMGTYSFYPAHQITMGEGGAVVTANARLDRLLKSYRDWGRDCWCAPGADNTCGKRFGWQMGELPCGYDHKYTYSRLGYNLKVTEMQAAIGFAQLDKLDDFLSVRRRNFKALYEGLRPYEEFLMLPEATPNSEPSWFGFPLTLREGAPFKREALTAFLEKRRIGTRLLFAGNITRQPYFSKVPYRKIGSLENSDKVMRDTFWIGVYPGISSKMITYVIESFGDFFRNSRSLYGDGASL